MKKNTIIKKKKITKINKQIKNFNKMLSKTFTVTREIDEIHKCAKRSMSNNKPTKMLINILVSTKNHGSYIKKSVSSKKFVIPNIENISNANLLKIVDNYDR